MGIEPTGVGREGTRLLLCACLQEWLLAGLEEGPLAKLDLGANLQINFSIDNFILLRNESELCLIIGPFDLDGVLGTLVLKLLSVDALDALVLHGVHFVVADGGHGLYEADHGSAALGVKLVVVGGCVRVEFGLA